MSKSQKPIDWIVVAYTNISVPGTWTMKLGARGFLGKVLHWAVDQGYVSCKYERIR